MGVEAERNELSQRIKELETLNSKLMEAKTENERLRGLLGFTQQTGYRGVVATVVGRDPSNWRRTITLDRGTADGVQVGMPVVDGDAIVGQVSVAASNTSQVLLLTDPTSAIDVLIQSSRASGIVEGGFSDEVLQLRYVQKLEEQPVRAGDRVIASGLDKVFPKGIAVGVVHKIDVSTSGLFYGIEVKPKVDVSRLENVMVLVPESLREDTSSEALEAKKEDAT